MAAAALNPIDHKMGVQGFRLDVFPAVLGIDGAGTVEALGEGVDSDKLQKGDSILFERLKFASDYGTFQQYALINAKRTYKIPDTLSFEQAATFPLCLTTAAIGLYAPYAPRGGVALTAPWQEGGLGKYKDQPALVIGGSGSVGQFALQMLKLSGFNPIIATASAHNEAYVRVAGATHLIDYHTTPYDALAGAVAHITSTPLPIVFDAIAHDDTQRAAWELTAPGGALVMVRQPVVGEAGVELEGGRRIAYVWPAVNFMDEEEAGRKWADGMYAGLQEYILDGRVKVCDISSLF
ncbi:NAD(P)-binding protein [Dentipellis sp. KUC8613]|nr:NAD(P)-binding protein [Dentipellis sp. KUC8613]